MQLPVDFQIYSTLSDPHGFFFFFCPCPPIKVNTHPNITRVHAFGFSYILLSRETFYKNLSAREVLFCNFPITSSDGIIPYCNLPKMESLILFWNSFVTCTPDQRGVEFFFFFLMAL